MPNPVVFNTADDPFRFIVCANLTSYEVNAIQITNNPTDRSGKPLNDPKYKEVIIFHNGNLSNFWRNYRELFDTERTKQAHRDFMLTMHCVEHWNPWTNYYRGALKRMEDQS